MINFPNAPTNGQQFQSGASTWQWDATKWIPVTTTAPLPLAVPSGGTGATSLTGVLIGNGTGAFTAQTPLSVTNGGTGASTAAAAPFVETAGDTMTGLLQIAPLSGNAELYLSKPASGVGAYIYGRTLTANRWLLNLANTEAETGSNAGSNFQIYRYNDAGTFIDAPLTIYRATGAVLMTGSLVINQNAAALPAVPATVATTLRIGGSDGGLSGLHIDAYGTNQVPRITGSNARGTAAARTAIQSGDSMLAMMGMGVPGNNATETFGAQISLVARENWTGTANGSYATVQTVAPGTTTIETPVTIGRGLVVGGTVTNDPGVGSIYATGSITISNNTDAIFTLVKPGARSWSLYSRGSDGAFAILDGTGVAWRMAIDAVGSTTFYGDVTLSGNFRFDGNNYIIADRGGGLMYFNTGAKGLWTLRSSDNLVYNNQGTVAGNGGYVNLASFAKLKHNVRAIPDPVERIKKLKPVAYTYTPLSEEQHGFIIEDLVTAYPETIKYHPDTGMPEGYRSEPIIAGMAAALQDALRRIEVLEGK